jgi:hypothetical protein
MAILFKNLPCFYIEFFLFFKGSYLGGALGQLSRDVKKIGRKITM